MLVERGLASLQHLSKDQVWSSRQAGAQKAGQKGADPKTEQTNERASILRTGSLKLKTESSGCALRVLAVEVLVSVLRLLFGVSGLVLPRFWFFLPFLRGGRRPEKPIHLSEGVEDVVLVVTHLEQVSPSHALVGNIGHFCHRA